jgi:hypothetical protein
MDLMINKVFKAIIFFIIVFVYSGCGSQIETNQSRLLTADSIPSIKQIYNIDELIEEICWMQCKENLASNKFSVKYDLQTKSFTNIGKVQNIINLPLIGYKCPDSFSDFFYTKKEIPQYIKNDSLLYQVQNHIISTRANDNYPVVFEIIANKESTLEDLSEIIYHVLEGYLLVYEEYALVKWNKQIPALTEKEIIELKAWEPIRIRIVDDSGSIYCK